jgi:hypothetical protein
MIATYPARYEDVHRKERTAIENDGKYLRMVVRGVPFQGSQLDDFEPMIDPSDPRMATFTIDHGLLWAYQLSFVMPLAMLNGEQTVTGRLRVQLMLGLPITTLGQADRETLNLRLTHAGTSVASSGTSGGWFENELLDIQRALPQGMRIKACFTCAFSDYSPLGNGLLGTLACFRDNKEAYRKVASKYELFAIWDTMTEFVQETYLCPEYEDRLPNTGYRG